MPTDARKNKKGIIYQLNAQNWPRPIIATNKYGDISTAKIDHNQLATMPE